MQNEQTVKSAPHQENANPLTGDDMIITQNYGDTSSIRFKVGLNHKYIDKNGAANLSGAGDWTPTDVNFTELAEHIGKGHPWMPAVIDDGMVRKKANCNYAEVLSLDIDKGLTIGEFLDHRYAQFCGLLIESSSSSPELEKFRAVFRLPGVIKDDDNRQSTFNWSGVSNTDRVIDRVKSELSDGAGSTAGCERSSQNVGDLAGTRESGEVCATGSQRGLLSGSGGTCERVSSGVGFDKHIPTRHAGGASPSEQADKLRSRFIYLGGSEIGTVDYSNLSDSEKVERIQQRISKWQTNQVIDILNRYLLSQVREADGACKDVTRFYFGALNRVAVIINEYAELPLTFILEALDRHDDELAKLKKNTPIEHHQFGIPAPAFNNGEMTADQYEALLNAYVSGYEKGTGTNGLYCSAIIGCAKQFGASDTRRIWTAFDARNPGEWSEPFHKVLERHIDYANGGYAGREATFGSAMYLLHHFGYRPQKTKSDRQRTDEENQAELDRIGAMIAETTKRMWPITSSFDKRYVDPDDITLKQGVITMISSACGTGKTVAIRKMIDTFAASVHQSFNDMKVRLVGYRNALGQQTAERWGMFHIHELMKEEKPDDIDRLAFCIDSIMQIKIENIGFHEVWVMDEIVNVMKHFLGGGTLKKRQGAVIDHLIACLNKVLAYDGTLVCSEENIPDYAIQQLNNLLGGEHPIELHVNECYPNKYKVTIGAGDQSGLIEQIVADLANGKKLIVVSDAQTVLERIDVMLQQAGTAYRIMRVDSTQKDNPDVQLFMTRPNDTVYDLLLMSPTAESGVSIDVPGYDKVYAMFNHLDTRTHIQMLERYRMPVERVIYCKNSDKRGFNAANAEKLYEYQLNVTRYMIEQTNVASDLEGVINAKPDQQKLVEWSVNQLVTIANIGNNPAEKTINMAAAVFAHQNGLERAVMLEGLTQRLIERGCDVSLCEWGKSRMIKDGLDMAEESRLDTHADALHNAPGDLDVDVAKALLQAGNCGAEQRLNAEKTVATKITLPGVEFTFDFIRQVFIKEKSRQIRKNEMYLAIDHPEIARSKDANNLITSGTKMYAQTTTKMLQADWLRQYFMQAGRPVEGVEHDRYDQRIIASYNWARNNVADYELAFGVPFRYIREQVRDENGRIIIQAFTVDMFYRQMCGLIGLTFKASQRLTKEGTRYRTYVWSNANCEHRQTILAGLANRYEEIMQNASQEAHPARSSIKDVLTTVTTSLMDASSQAIEQVTTKCSELYSSVVEILTENGEPLENFTFSFG
jgi:hypothetical protein